MRRHFLIQLALAIGTAALGSGSASACSWRGSSNCGTDDYYVALPAYSDYAPIPVYGYGQPPSYAFVPGPAYGYGPPSPIYGYRPAPAYGYAQPPSYGYAPPPMHRYRRDPSYEFRSPAYGYRGVGERRR